MANERKIVEERIRRLLLKEYIMKKTRRAGFGGLGIQRTPMGYRVTLVSERPGLVIGRKGASIKELTNAVEAEFGFENPQIEVQEVENPSLNPQIMAEKLASALERGWHFRRAGHSTVRRIMDAGAKGCLVTISGKVTGRRHRMEKFKAGHIKFCGEPKQLWMRKGFAVAKVKLGVIGAKVQIMDPNARLPDEIEIVEQVQEGEGVESVGDEASTEAEASPAQAEDVSEEESPQKEEVEEEMKEEARTEEVDDGTAEDERDKGDEQRGEKEEAERT
ncbi:MAG: 30S ribosomal protein S3 [Thermoplasmata archaeon]